MLQYKQRQEQKFYSQRQPVVQMKKNTAQNKTGAVIQRMKQHPGKTQQDSAATRHAAPGAASALPAGLRAGVEKQSGFDMGGVQVHYNSPEPERLGAAAFARGSEIHLGVGQEQHLPHEAWHVVQQAQGRVAPSVQMKGGPANENPALEREADTMGARSAQTGGKASSVLAPLPSMQGVAQFERSRKAWPLLANERDLLMDTEDILNGKERYGLDSRFLDTTYGNIGDNLILDINMLYEEHLQREIEHNAFYKIELQKAVKYIHEKLEIKSITTGERANNSTKSARIKNVEKYLSQKLNKTITIAGLKTDKWIITIPEGVTAVDQGLIRGYVKLLKMLETQNPYFGGATEYEHDEKDSFEYLIYHMSTLTRDPDRQYLEGTDSKLKKPMKDYRTHPGSLVPAMNQRNLGTGITEAKWEELPDELQVNIYYSTGHLMDKAGREKSGGDKKLTAAERLVKLNKLATDKNVTTDLDYHVLIRELWNGCDEDQKKELYGDILRVPWSGVHREHQAEHERKAEQNIPKNVVGVRGNFLETPSKAGARYETELNALKTSAPTALEALNKKMGNAADQTNHDAMIKDLKDEFIELHGDCYTNAKEAHKPMIGGISGHTLGYLNLYEEALSKDEGMLSEAKKGTPETAGDDNIPSMEVLRACMLGALIGDKRHHSYDEVMTASHGMPAHPNVVKAYGCKELQMPQLQYFFKLSYEDVRQSLNPAVQASAKEATNKTKAAVNMPNKNTVQHRVEDSLREKGKQTGDSSFTKKLREILIDYADEYYKQEEAPMNINDLLAGAGLTVRTKEKAQQ